MKNFFKINKYYFLLLCISSFSQTAIFNSKIQFSENQLSTFYSSFSIDSSQVYFLANDYNLHTYDKKTGDLKWTHYLASKTNSEPKVFENSILVKKHLDENLNRTIQLNAKTGDTIQTLKIDALETKPIFRNSVMYCATISPEIGGAIMAYDLKTNAIVWQKFIAHGVSTQPYYLKNKIVANAEGDNWFDVDYNGNLIDTTCTKKADLFVDGIKCVKNFRYLSHDEKEITASFLDKSTKDEGFTIEYQGNNTFFLGNETLLVLGNKRKIRNMVRLSDLLTNLPEEQNSYRKILKTDKNTIWFFYESNLISYDYIKNKTIKIIDFSKWKPHQVILEDQVLWLISKNDGQLYGLKID